MPSPDVVDDGTTLDELLEEPQKSPTWVALSGVDVTPRAAAWLDELGARVEADLLPITVTSGRRSPQRQARALHDDLVAGQTPQQLHALYQRDDLLDEVLAVADEGVEAMTEVLALQLARGEHLSPHMRDDAVDLRRRNRSTEQLGRLVAHCQALGAQTVIERDHLHVQHLTPRPRA
ncbi:hypothetical protein L6R53_14020 [Myxococcota bacterium]|nr:hypothetical protein [Myxococcota bacterium]